MFVVCDGACRRDSKRQLQPVPGGDLWDWVRWGSQNETCFCYIQHVMHISLVATIFVFVFFVFWLMRNMLSADLQTSFLCVAGRAGATASVSCSLCQAGTYGTGSGEGLRMRLVLL